MICGQEKVMTRIYEFCSNVQHSKTSYVFEVLGQDAYEDNQKAFTKNERKAGAIRGMYRHNKNSTMHTQETGLVISFRVIMQNS